MRRSKSLLSCLCLVFVLFFSAAPVAAQQTFQTTSETTIGLLQYLPKDYNSNSNKYPLVIFLHGIGERGANSTNKSTLEGTIHLVDNLGPPRHVKDGHNFPFILISPQLKNNHGNWPIWYVLEVINWAKSKFRVDEKRIHITGLSLGGGGAWTMMQEYPKLFASGSPLCGGYNSPAKALNIARENLPVWTFHGDADKTVPLSRTSTMVNAINASSPTPNPRAKLTVYPGVKHDAWGRAYRPDHAYDKPNVYEWMMSQHNRRNGSNSLPTANAGSDKTYSGTTKITLSGSGNDSDGSIRSYKWSKLSGPAATIAKSSSASTSVSVTTGTYIFKLTVTDDDGDTDSDYVKVTISSGSSTQKPGSGNANPVVNAGPDITLQLPASTARLNGSAKDSDGTIKSYKWTKISGPAANLSNATTRSLTAWGLVKGTYVFRLTARDNDGAAAHDDVRVVVNGSSSSSSSNKAPTANAGSDVTLRLPASTARLSGRGSDSDGQIKSYRWTKISGPSANLSNASTKNLIAWKLVQGTYLFRLTVTDDKGATAYDDVRVVVSGSSSTKTSASSSSGNKTPAAFAGKDITMYAPASTARLYGGAKDPDGHITSYRWTKISGPAAKLSNADTKNLTAWSLRKGTYVFRLTVKDNKGASGYDDVRVVIK
jgi:poly(3-hydroxybutyrate) depolymerase